VGERPVTTYRGSIEHLRTKYAGLEVRANERWVDAGDIVTSAGVSAGIDMALHIVSRLYGPAAAAATAHEIEYDYWPRAGG
ncbi:MAG: DJ-1/PfpI family protein, partial [Anaerolineales bacterium]